MSKMIEISDEDCEEIETWYPYLRSAAGRVRDAVIAAGPSAPDPDIEITIHDESGFLWAETKGSPGVFATGSDMKELGESLAEALNMVIPSAPTFKLGDLVHVEYDGQIVGVDSDAALRLYTVEVFDDEWSMVPGYLAAEHLTRIDDEACPNCDGRKCMACVAREVHDDCVDDCPECCTDDDDGWDARQAEEVQRVARIDDEAEPDVVTRITSTGDGPTIHGEFLYTEPADDDAKLAKTPPGWAWPHHLTRIDEKGTTNVENG